MMRTSTSTDSVPPTRVNFRSSSTRSRSSCSFGADVADLVEEQRAAGAPTSNLPLWRATAPVNAPLLVAEQLRLEQRLGQRRARHGHERPVGARALGVDGAREQLLAGAALAEHQDRRVAPRGRARQLEDLLHRRALADHVAEAVVALAAPCAAARSRGPAPAARRSSASSGSAPRGRTASRGSRRRPASWR